VFATLDETVNALMGRIRAVSGRNYCETRMTILPFIRAIRDSSAPFKLIHSALRGPYYTILDILYPRGIRIALSGNVQVRLAPRSNVRTATAPGFEEIIFEKRR
jgi:hypothetical protein